MNNLNNIEQSRINESKHKLDNLDENLIQLQVIL